MDKVNVSANTILREIPNLLENPTKPPKKPPDAAAYAITNNDVHDKMRDGLCKADASVIERDKLEGVHVGAGYEAALSTKQLQQATITCNIPSIMLDSGASSTYVKPPAKEMRTSECGEYTWKAPLT